MSIDLNEILSAVQRIAAFSGTGVIVLVIYGFLKGELYTGKQYREMVADRDFYRDKFVAQTATLEQELGVE